MEAFPVSPEDSVANTAGNGGRSICSSSPCPASPRHLPLLFYFLWDLLWLPTWQPPYSKQRRIGAKLTQINAGLLCWSRVRETWSPSPPPSLWEPLLNVEHGWKACLHSWLRPMAALPSLALWDPSWSHWLFQIPKTWIQLRELLTDSFGRLRSWEGNL